MDWTQWGGPGQAATLTPIEPAWYFPPRPGRYPGSSGWFRHIPFCKSRRPRASALLFVAVHRLRPRHALRWSGGRCADGAATSTGSLVARPHRAGPGIALRLSPLTATAGMGSLWPTGQSNLSRPGSQPGRQSNTDLGNFSGHWPAGLSRLLNRTTGNSAE